MGTTVLINPYQFGAAFTPTQIAGLKVWLKADTLALADNDPVDTWADQSGVGNNVTAAGTARPLYKTNIRNGLPAVRFDGSNDMMSGASAVTFRHVFVAFYHNGAAFPIPGGAVGYSGVVSGTVNTDLVILTGHEGTTRFFDDTLTTVYHRDGTLKAENDMQAPMLTWGVCAISYATGWTVTPRLGKDRNNSGRHLNGDIGEVLAYDTVLSTADRQSVEAYLKSRWATP